MRQSCVRAVSFLSLQTSFYLCWRSCRGNPSVCYHYEQRNRNRYTQYCGSFRSWRWQCRLRSFWIIKDIRSMDLFFSLAVGGVHLVVKVRGTANRARLFSSRGVLALSRGNFHVILEER
ncbi:hypothetical protein KC353_g28 [Hortaea werneckii]|nr:hypothetical protein KC353_g28 [Hortaea werneckii]